MLDTSITQERLQYVHALIDLRSAYVTQFFHWYKPRLIIMHNKESSFHPIGQLRWPLFVRVFADFLGAFRW